jgi:putative oxygen-independent coproporphyrinogen III oxidase
VRPDTPAFGVYVHIPFCAKRCDYCAFATWTDRMNLADAYLDACVTDLDRAVAAGVPAATSVFFGGGTPSLVPADALMRVLAHIPLVEGAEVTVECNPDTVDSSLVHAYRRGGVSRLSFGVQSMLPHVLASLGRTHDPNNVTSSVAFAREAGFESFNLDLIYGAAGESLADWTKTLERALELDPPHMSAYGLTVEAGTPLADEPHRHPDDDDQADKYLVADRMLSDAGLGSYEISNWAKPGFECRHNLLYWSQGEYLGVGCAAHSHRDGVRWWNVRTPDRYIDAIAAGRSPVAASERLDEPERRIEALQLALRTRDGVPIESLPEELEDLVERRGNRVVLTVRGRLLANEVALRLS